MRADGNIREIVFDTETTGFNALVDDRITEIGAIEVIDFMPTGRSFHAYLDPQREDISLASRDKHGAIVDSELLALVYLELNGGKERRFGFQNARDVKVDYVVPVAKPRTMPLPKLSTEDERSAHAGFVRSLGQEMVWYRYDLSAE